ncbi:MAG: Ig-like domain-containing protein, partial [Acutalibacteraceae bacterium]|nr:Ig-like domain-containing protein [Acutalibacteraceae bacterium]
ASGNKGSLTFKSSNTAVATVDSAGKVTAKSGGTEKITITAAETAQYNAASTTITVNVAKAAQSITAKASATVVFVGQTMSVSVTGAKGATSFKSSDTSIASVTSAGMVTAKNTGTVEITATSAATAQYNAVSKTVTIKVVPAVTSSLTAANQVTGIKLAWKKVAGATGYKIYRNATLIKTITDGSTVTYTDAKANTNMLKYVYKVVAKGPAGDSALAKTVTAYRVNRPALSSVTNSAASVITAKWTTIARVNGYQIKYSMSKTFASGNGIVSSNDRNANSKRIGNLMKGKTYYVKVRAYKLVGNGVYWSEWSPVRTVRISR